MHKFTLLCLLLVATLIAGQINYCGDSEFSNDRKQCDNNDDQCCDENCRFRPSSFACDTSDTCHSTSYCSGDSGLCAERTVLVGIPCRVATSCQNPALCQEDGSCPAISYKAQGTVCSKGTGCFQDAVCPGPAGVKPAQCPNRQLQPATHVCKAADPSKPCELDTYCKAPGTSGADGSCPTYGQPAATTVKCGDKTDSNNACEQEERFCPGTKDPVTGEPDECPDYAKPVTAGTQCGTATGDCEEDPVCPGTAGTIGQPDPCPVRGEPMSAGTSCGSEDPNPSACVSGLKQCQGGNAESEESYTCNSIGSGAETTCHTAEGPCDVDVQCDGTYGSCPTATDFPNAETDCSSECTVATQTAKCDGNGNCGVCETPGGTSDPLITGFHHQKFWFEGKSGSVYNFFSQPEVAVNALIVNAKSVGKKAQTVMSAIGFMTANNEVVFDAVNGPQGKVIVNGKNVTLTTKVNLIDLNDCVQLAWSPKAVSFSSAGFEIVFAFKANNKKEDLNVAYLNTKFVHVSGDVESMNGVIGQTAQKKLDKNAAHFEVDSLTSFNSAKNTYTKAALSCEKKARTESQFGAATQHQLDDLKKYSWTFS